MMRGIELPVLWSDVEPIEGVEIERSQMYNKNIVFYTIDNLIPLNKSETIIMSAGDEYICPLPIKALQKKIDERRGFELN